jgi:hypothetical protein
LFSWPLWGVSAVRPFQILIESFRSCLAMDGCLELSDCNSCCRSYFHGVLFSLCHLVAFLNVNTILSSPASAFEEFRGGNCLLLGTGVVSSSFYIKYEFQKIDKRTEFIRFRPWSNLFEPGHRLHVPGAKHHINSTWRVSLDVTNLAVS